MAYANAVANNIAAIRSARKEGAALRAAKLASKKQEIVPEVKKAVTFEDVMNILSTDPFTGEPLPQAKPEVIEEPFMTRKELIEACQAMDLDEVLFSCQRRTPTQHRGYAVERALARFVNTTFGQKYHAINNGEAQVENPRWFKQLYTDLAWSTNDITPGAILQALV